MKAACIANICTLGIAILALIVSLVLSSVMFVKTDMLISDIISLAGGALLSVGLLTIAICCLVSQVMHLKTLCKGADNGNS